MTEKVDIVISGITGKMGSLVYQEIRKSYNDRLNVKFGVCSKQGVNENSLKLYTVDTADFTDITGIIDFSKPEVLLNLIKKLRDSKTRKFIVSGTTGLSKEQLSEIYNIIKNEDSKISLLHSPNFSILVNMQIYLSKLVAQKLSKYNYDFGLVEEHHVMKKDSPSGTAKKIITNVMESKNLTKVNYWSEELRTKNKDEFDVAVLRLGGTIGLHELRIVGQHGRMTIETLMYNRTEFAIGAIESLLWLIKNGKEREIHSFEEVIGINE
ncbi:MAG: 4-hydroxy-tetrahydrodipicolinate reductase [Candidatus Anstonellales archaeon]